MRKVLIGIAVLLVILVAAAFVVPRFIPADSLKADIAEQVRAATGRDLIIDGDLSFTLLPAPGVSASGVRLSNIDGARTDDMVRLKSAQVAVALGPLFGGTIEIERVVLVEPVFELEQLADGSNNWTFTGAQTADQPSANGGGAADASGSGGFGSSVQLNDLVVRDGTVNYRSPELTERIENINASFGAASLVGPFRADGEAVLRGMPTRLNVAIGELKTERAIPINLSTGVENAEFTFSGIISGFPDEPRMSGGLEGEAADIAELIAAVSGQKAPAALAGAPLALKGDLAANREAVALNNMSVGLGDLSATGAASMNLGETPALNLIMNVGQLDLDALLAAVPSSGGEKSSSGGAGGGGDAAVPGDGSSTNDAAAGFVLPQTLNATVEAKAEAVRFRGGVIRQAALNAELAGGKLSISQLTARLPGSADVALFGSVEARDGAPAFAGQGEASADDLRGLLAWLGVDISAVPLDRLNKLALTAKMEGTPAQLNVTDIDLGIDGSRLRGGVAIALRQRLGLGIGLTLDKLNIDAYLPQAVAAAKPADATAQPAPGDAPNAGAAPTPAGSGLAVFDRFDSVLQLKAGTLTYRGKSIQGVNIDGTLAAGVFELRDASVENLAGARAKTSGRVEGLASAAPTVDLNLEIDTQDSDRLLDMLGTAPTFAVGPGRLRGSVTGNLETLNLDLKLAALDAELTTKGKLLRLIRDPEFDLSFDLRHDDTGALVARIGGDAKAVKSARAAGALRIAAAVTGNLPESAFSAGIDIGAGRFNVRGQITDAGTDRMAGSVALSGEHPSLTKAVRIFSPGYRPALSELGALKFSTDMAFDPAQLRIDNLRGNAGPVNFESTANVALAGVRPNVTGELKTSEIIVDWFLPVPKQAARSGGSGGASPSGQQPAKPRGGAERWSHERIDISALRNFDGNIALTAPAITYTDLKVDNPKVAMKLADGVLDLSELSGRAYGGAFNMTGQVADKKVPTLSYVLSIVGADAAQFTGATGQEGRGVMSVLDLLFPVSSVKLTSGTLDANIDVASKGRSERELISALAGNGQVKFTNAVAEGVDVCRISNQLGNLNGLEGFLGLVLSAQGGTTRIANYAGQFDIVKGIARLPRQRITADCATIDFAGNVDLPRWLVDIQAKALFPEHPKFPGVIVEEKGQLDRPNIRFVNSNEVQQYIIGKSAGSVLRKLVPGIEPQPAPAPQNGSGSQPAPAPQPAEQFRGLLKDLLRSR